MTWLSFRKKGESYGYHLTEPSAGKSLVSTIHFMIYLTIDRLISGTKASLNSGQYSGYLPEHCARPWGVQCRLRRLSPEQFNYRTAFSLIFRRGRSRDVPTRALLKLQAAAGD
ncbi:hypothetical protein [Serratia proteamaculans]